MQKLIEQHAILPRLEVSLTQGVLLMLLTLMSFKFGVCWMKIGLRTGTNHSVFVVLVNAGANATSKFSFQHSHNTSFGRHSPLLLRATPSLIFAFRAISGDVKDVFVTVSKIYICLTHF